MSYNVKEIYYTLQGEGAQAGRAAVFCRLTGCNLWSGREQDRNHADCSFCDTDFIGTDGQNGGKFKTAQDLAKKISTIWGDDKSEAFVVFTGGEPSLQLDNTLIEAVKDYGFEVAIESNGTNALPESLDWICISPKPNQNLKQTRGHELKFIYPQDTLSPEDFIDLDFEHFYLQPMFCEDEELTYHNIQASITYCLQNPQWQLSLQIHKIIGID